MTEEILYLIGDVIMFTAIIGAIVFAVSYVTFFAWRRTSAGRSLLYFVLALIVWAIQSFMARIDPDYAGRAWSRLVVYLLISATVWRLVVTLWRSWNHSLEVEPRKKER